MSQKKKSQYYLFAIPPIALIAFIWAGFNYFSDSQKLSEPQVDQQTLLVSNWDESKFPYDGNQEITVYRSPSCGCCGVWIEHMKKHGFQITDIKTEDMEAIKQKYNVPKELTSCHTAVIDGYVMEGHIPADDIKRFLVGKPQFQGLAVAGMPIGSPGMESAKIKQPFTVFAFDHQGKTTVFNSYEQY
jgi:hypothetical protein